MASLPTALRCGLRLAICQPPARSCRPRWTALPPSMRRSEAKWASCATPCVRLAAVWMAWVQSKQSDRPGSSSFTTMPPVVRGAVAALRKGSATTVRSLQGRVADGSCATSPQPVLLWRAHCAARSPQGEHRRRGRCGTCESGCIQPHVDRHLVYTHPCFVESSRAFAAHARKCSHMPMWSFHCVIVWSQGDVAAYL